MSEEESEDQGLCFDDIISPGGQHLSFGTIENMEIKNIWHMQISDDSSMPINEYGTNLFRSKFDPLAAFEAKTALRSGKLSESLDEYTKGDELTHMLGKTIENVDLPTQQEAVCPNPALGIQEAPIGYFSSQDPEENPELNPREKDGETVNESDFLQFSRVGTGELIATTVNSNISDLVEKREAVM